MRFLRVGKILLALLTFGGCAPAMTAPPDLIAVNGTGSVTVTPDIALAQVGVEVHAAQPTDAIAEATQRMTRVLDSIRALGISDKDIATTRYSIDPILAPRPNPGDVGRPDGYRVTNVVQVRIRDVTVVGRVLDAVVRAGANRILSLSFTTSDQRGAEGQARALAVRDAATKAQQIADAAGVRVGPLVSVTETPRPFVGGLASAVMASGASVPVEPGGLEIAVSVEARYRITR